LPNNTNSAARDIEDVALVLHVLMELSTKLVGPPNNLWTKLCNSVNIGILLFSIDKESVLWPTPLFLVLCEVLVFCSFDNLII